MPEFLEVVPVDGRVYHTSMMKAFAFCDGGRYCTNCNKCIVDVGVVAVVVAVAAAHDDDDDDDDAYAVAVAVKTPIAASVVAVAAVFVWYDVYKSWYCRTLKEHVLMPHNYRIGQHLVGLLSNGDDELSLKEVVAVMVSHLSHFQYCTCMPV